MEVIEKNEKMKELGDDNSMESSDVRSKEKDEISVKRRQAVLKVPKER